MGEIVRDFWTYTNKSGNFHGIIEVVKGDLRYRRQEKKFETHVDKAFGYVMAPGRRVLSHMSLQSYTTFLGAEDRSYRNADEVTYYPFTLEFEPHLKDHQLGFAKQYCAAAKEAYRCAGHLIYQMNVDPDDIMIVITNHRSIYLYVNPKTYGLKPSKDLHSIYRRMYEVLKDELDLKYIDEAMYRFNGLVKTPGSYYSGGFVVPISMKELAELAFNPDVRNELTKKKREINKNVPGALAGPLEELYLESRSQVAGKVARKGAQKPQNNDNVIGLAAKRLENIGCIRMIEECGVQQGQRNFALVSLAIAYKNAGYNESEAYEMVQSKADAWGHDEDAAKVASKVRTVFRKDYNFSCQYIKENVDVCSSCAGCKYAQKAQDAVLNKFKVNRYAINRLKEGKASLRHYKAYLTMARHRLFGQSFSLEKYGLDQRTIRELAKLIQVEREAEGDQVFIGQEQDPKYYLIPIEFYDEEVYLSLQERLKQYLIIYLNVTRKAYDRYGIMNVKIKRLTELLGYTNERSTHNLIKALVDAGMFVFNKGRLVAIYYKSRKVKSIEEYKKEVAERKHGSTQLPAHLSWIKDQEEGIKRAAGDHRTYVEYGRGSP